jgi:hypothetical protein
LLLDDTDEKLVIQVCAAAVFGDKDRGFHRVCLDLRTRARFQRTVRSRLRWGVVHTHAVSSDCSKGGRAGHALLELCLHRLSSVNEPV